MEGELSFHRSLVENLVKTFRVAQRRPGVLGASVTGMVFNRLMLPKVGALPHPQNIASIRVLEKLGFTHVRDVFHEACDRLVPVFKLACPDRRA